MGYTVASHILLKFLLMKSAHGEEKCARLKSTQQHANQQKGTRKRGKATHDAQKNNTEQTESIEVAHKHHLALCTPDMDLKLTCREMRRMKRLLYFVVVVFFELMVLHQLSRHYNFYLYICDVCRWCYGLPWVLTATWKRQSTLDLF